MQDRARIILDPELPGLAVHYGGQIVGLLKPDPSRPKHAPGMRMVFAEGVPPEARQTIQTDLTGQLAHLGDSLIAVAHDIASEKTCASAGAAARDIAPAQRTRLHLGCGRDARPGFLNVDYLPGDPNAYDAARGFLNHDLRLGLPDALRDGRAELVYSCHFLEHLTLPQARRLLSHCRDALAPGGTLRSVLPDYEVLLSAYAGRDPEVLERILASGSMDHLPAAHRCYADVVSRGVYEFFEHKYIYDAESFCMMLADLDFADVRRVDWDDAIDGDRPRRRENSFCVEARRA